MPSVAPCGQGLLAISIGLILSMLIARSSVNTKIDQVKSNAGTNITISPAGVFGFAGGGNNLTSSQLSKISKTGKKIFDMLHTLSRIENTTILAVTHDMEIAGKTDRTFTLKDGKIVA